jgi:hypothetical protein
VVVHVEDKILAHDGQANHCDIAFRFHCVNSVLFTFRKVRRHDSERVPSRQKKFPPGKFKV